jgi:hypothetical protein
VEGKQEKTFAKMILKNANSVLKELLSCCTTFGS